MAAALGRPPFSALQVRSRDAIEARLAAQPLARGLLDVLAMSALLALVLGVAGLVLVCAADLGDERDHLVDLEAMGVGPGALRHHLLLRAAMLVLAVFAWSDRARARPSFALAGLALVWVFARTAFRAPVPGRIGGGA